MRDSGVREAAIVDGLYLRTQEPEENRRLSQMGLPEWWGARGSWPEGAASPKELSLHLTLAVKSPGLGAGK